MTLTTASSPTLTPWRKDALQKTLAGFYALVWMWAAIAPVSRMDWFLENLLVAAGITSLFWMYRDRPLSDLSAILVAAFLALHTVGSHYTYSEVPIGNWLKELLGLSRNHYDRVVHLSFGLLLTYPLREILARGKITNARWAGFFAFAIVGACSAIYEILEWAVGAVVDPQAGMAFLGTQGDEFDSQKDSGLAIAGSLVALILTAIFTRSRK